MADYSKATDLFSPTRLGAIEVSNRIAMAPLTRSRVGENGVLGELQATYYAQRASAGLIVSEATNIAAEGCGYAMTPGIWTDEQVAGWRGITDAVHAAGGKIVNQLWHVGRISHVDLQPNGQPPVAPSAITAEGKAFTNNGFADFSTPRALETDEIPRVIADYAHAAKMAKEAGFDGVERQHLAVLPMVRPLHEQSGIKYSLTPEQGRNHHGSPANTSFWRSCW